MALYRLLQVKSTLRLQRAGLMKPTRYCYCTSSKGVTEKSSQSKKPSLAKEQKAVAVESFVKRYMEAHPGNFPKATHVQNKVGGSWYTLKDILTNLKEKMLGNPQLHPHTNDTSDSTVDATPVQDFTAHNNKDISKPGEAKGTVMNSEFNKDNISSTAASCMSGENSSKNMINATASEIVQMCTSTENTEHSEPERIVQSLKSSGNSDNNEKNTTNATSHVSEEYSPADCVNLEAFKFIKMHNYPDSIKLAEPACTAQLPEVQVVSHGNEKGISTSATSHVISENSFEDMIPSDSVSDGPKLVELENGHMKPDRAVSDITSSDGDYKSMSEQLSCFPILAGPSRILQGSLNGLASTGYRNCQPETETMSSSLTPNAGSEVDGTPPVSFDGAYKLTGSADLFMRRMNDREVVEMTGEKNNSVTPNSPEYSNEKDMVKSCDIMALIDCIKELPRERSIIRSLDNIISNKTSNKSAIRGRQSQDNSQRFDNKGRKTSLNDHHMGIESNNFTESNDHLGTRALYKVFATNSKSENKEGSDTDIAAFERIKSKPSPRVPLPTIKEGLNKIRDEFLAGKGSDENKVFLRFLHKAAEKSDIYPMFQDCGCITKIEFQAKGSLYKIACVYFKTKKEMQKALKKTDLMFRNVSAIVEAACSTENMPNKTLIPNLIGDPDVPASLVKNPIRTVMIKELTPDISSRDIEEALAFCGSNISGFFFGSSSSVAYVEFETEEAKERALEKHSINVSCKQLLIFRIDAPRTTVVRLSNLCFPEASKKLYSICKDYGQVKHVIPRSKQIVDVYFKLAEWPNMLKILNQLNGVEIYGRQWIAQPAPVFPPEVIHALWSCTDEKRRLKTKFHSLLQKLEECPPADIVGLTAMATEYYSTDHE